MPPRRNGRWLIIGLVLAVLILNVWVSSNALSPTSRVRVPYSPTFLTQVTDGNVQSIDSTGESVQGTFKHPFAYQGSAATVYFATQIPSFADNQALENILKQHGVVQNATNPDTGASFFEELLFGFGPTLFFILIIIWFMRRAASGGGAGGLMSFGRSRARRVEADEQPVTFRDVAGIDEAKEELTEIVDFLKNPDKYLKLGGRIPRGVLLVRPARDRQDAARARGRGRGGRAVLPDVGVGVRRDDRRRRRLART